LRAFYYHVFGIQPFYLLNLLNLGENFNGPRNFSEDYMRKNGQILRTYGSSVAAARGSILGRSLVRTDPSYLRTLSQTHAGWAFGAIAELIDNSRDANATRYAESSFFMPFQMHTFLFYLTVVKVLLSETIIH